MSFFFFYDKDCLYCILFSISFSDKHIQFIGKTKKAAKSNPYYRKRFRNSWMNNNNLITITKTTTMTLAMIIRILSVIETKPESFCGRKTVNYIDPVCNWYLFSSTLRGRK